LLNKKRGDIKERDEKRRKGMEIKKVSVTGNSYYCAPPLAYNWMYKYL